MNSEYAFSHSIRDALLCDERLVLLLGGTNVFEGYETEIATPHINICESALRDDCSGEESDNEATVTLQVWSHSGEKIRAQKIVEAVEQALAQTGFLEPDSKILLRRKFTGARKLPDNGEFQGILRYHAEGHPYAA